MSMLFMISKDRSNITGVVGILSHILVTVDSYGLLSMTSPMAVATTISPEGSPISSGSNITKLLPNSSTVTVKSVPRIAI